MWILTHAFFAETFQPINAALTFQIGLNDSARAIRGKFTFAGAWEGFWGIWTICKTGLNNWSISKSQKGGGRNQVSGWNFCRMTKFSMNYAS